MKRYTSDRYPPVNLLSENPPASKLEVSFEHLLADELAHCHFALSKRRLTEALEWLVQLYEATEQNERAAVWRKRLEARGEAEKKPTEPKEM